jgi:hypothetical protein
MAQVLISLASDTDQQTLESLFGLLAVHRKPVFQGVEYAFTAPARLEVQAWSDRVKTAFGKRVSSITVDGNRTLFRITLSTGLKLVR